MTCEAKLTEIERILVGGGEMGALVRSHDWSQTPLGSVEHWPQSLRTALSICLNSRFPMVIWWSEELILLYNDAWISILGAKHPQALGKPGREVWPEVWHIIGVQLNSVLTTQQATWSDDLLLVAQQHGYIKEAYFTYSYSPIFLESGKVGGAFTAVTETTRRVIGERRLDTLRELAANTGDARSVEETCRIASVTLAQNPYDISFALLYWVENESKQLRLIGTAGIESGMLASPHQIDLTQSQDPWDVNEVKRTGKAKIVNDVSERFDRLPGGAWQEATPSALVMPLIPSGQPQQLAGLMILGVSPRQEFDDEYRGFFDLVASHITTAIANARAYEEARQRAEALAELDRAKTLFFNNVSHEFRTPLTLMLSPLEEMLMVDDRVPLATQRQSLELVHRNGLRLLKLVNTLLDFSRIEADRIEAIYEPTDLAALTCEIASVFNSVIERAGMRLQSDCPALVEPVYVDRQMWEKIVLNLLSNAFKFTFAGEITVSIHQVGKQVELTVQDTGIGIPSPEIPHLFERFHQVKGMQGRSLEGSGIGLSLVQALVRLHDGTVTVTSTLGKGSCFTVSIPTGSTHLPPDRIGATRTQQSTALGAASYVEEVLRWLPDDESQEATISSASLSQSSSPFSTRILLVDDNSDMRNYIKRLLGDRYTVESVTNGIEALAAVHQQLPDLILTDVMMPELDGYGLLRELRADPITEWIPVILLSARAGEESRVEGLEAGADDYMIKPFSARELLARVETNLKMAKIRQEAYQREQALRIEAEAATEQMEQVLSRIDDQFLALDREGNYIYANDRVSQVLGILKEDLLGKNVWELLPAVAKSEFYTEVQRAMTEQTMIRFDYFYPLWQRWFESRVYPSANGVSIFIEEITDRKQAEAILAQRETELRLVTDTVPALIAFVDADQRYRFNNRAYTDWFGHSVAELHGKYLGEVLGETAYEVIRPYVERVLTGESVAFESVLLYKGDDIRYVNATYVPQFNGQGEVEGFVALVLDISDRKQAESALRDKELFLQNLTNNVPVMLWTALPDGTINFVSHPWTDFTGMTLESVTEEGWKAILHPDDFEETLVCWNQALRTHQPYEISHRVRRADGHYHWCISRAILTSDDQLKPLLWVGSAVDIERQKQIELTVTQTTELLKKRNQELDRFAYVVSHDLKAPLRAIANLSEWLEDDLEGQLPEENQHQMKLLRQRVYRMETLIDGLLTYSRVDRTPVAAEKIYVNQLITEIIDSLAPPPSFQIEVQPNLPTLTTKRLLLNQVFTNLISNAIKHHDRLDGRVEIFAQSRDSCYEFAVRDDGLGIKPEYHERIFNIFQTLKAKDAQENTGIGLSIVKKIIETEGGELRVESEVGKGTTFYFTWSV